jgi:hypothetical protein
MGTFRASFLRRLAAILLAAVAAVGGATTASAASYLFEVEWDGSTASLLPGSDDPLSTTLVDGDDFTYSLLAAPGFAWSTLAAGDLFPLMGLPVNEAGDRVVDFSLDFLLMGSSVYSISEIGSQQSFVHIGTNTISFPGGLVIDQFLLKATLIQATEPGGSNAVDTTFADIVPVFGTPDQSRFDPQDAMAFGPVNSAVPEPSTWALLLLGFFGIGGLMRLQKRNQRRAVAYA